MPNVVQQYNDRSQLIDDREFELGQIWTIKDELISIPQADRIDGARILHDKRSVVVVQNNEQNYNKMCPIITVAPLSSRIDLRRKYDILLTPEKDNVKVPCLVQLSLAQPVLKVDLDEMKGIISEESMAEIIDAQLERLGVDLD